MSLIGDLTGLVSTGAGLFDLFSGGPDVEDIYNMQRDLANTDYSEKIRAWQDYWNERLPRLTKSEQEKFKKISALLDQYLPKVKETYKELPQEREYRQFVENLIGQGQALYEGEKDPLFEERVRSKELDINKQFADTIQNYINANQREIARGGLPTINPERRDEMVAHALARARDESRGVAREEVATDLARSIGAQIPLLSASERVGSGERARTEASLNALFGIDMQKIQQESAFDNLLDALSQQQFSSRPDWGTTMNTWLAGLQPTGGPSTASKISAGAYGIGSMLDQAMNFWDNHGGTIQSGLNNIFNQSNELNYPTQYWQSPQGIQWAQNLAW